MAILEREQEAEAKPGKDQSQRCHILLTEDDGIVSAVVLNLPGAGSCGDTEAEALENVREAIQGVLASYGDSVPWQNTKGFKIPVGAKETWIVVDG